MKKHPFRGDVYWVNLNPTVGSEIQKIRPAVIISNNVSNEISKRVIIAPITSQTGKIFPFEASLEINKKKGKALLDQIRAVDKKRLLNYIETINEKAQKEIDKALKISLSLF